MTLLWDAPIWWDQFDQTLWWAFMQIACSAVAHAHAKRPLLTIALFKNEDCVPPKEISIKQALINRGYLLSVFIAHLSKVSDLINQIMIHRKCNGSIAFFFSQAKLGFLRSPKQMRPLQRTYLNRKALCNRFIVPTIPDSSCAAFPNFPLDIFLKT